MFSYELNNSSSSKFGTNSSIFFFVFPLTALIVGIDLEIGELELCSLFWVFNLLLFGLIFDVLGVVFL